MSGAGLLLQARPYHLYYNFAWLVVVFILMNVVSNVWLKHFETFAGCANYFQMMLWCYATVMPPHSGPSITSLSPGGRRLFRSRLRTQLNIPAPLHRGCAGVEQPLYPAEPTPPKILKYIIVLRPRGPRTWLVDIFSLHNYRQTD